MLPNPETSVSEVGSTLCSDSPRDVGNIVVILAAKDFNSRAIGDPDHQVETCAALEIFRVLPAP